MFITADPVNQERTFVFINTEKKFKRLRDVGDDCKKFKFECVSYRKFIRIL